ncbi:hypothetical protein F5884DRAFT_122227 [Xylogone sp. PMI_703]|nr:hypothetical protein F5884DRAFT_122227 [Xylogone sp. PMI_703]
MHTSPSLMLSLLTVCIFISKLGLSIRRIYQGKRHIASKLEAGISFVLLIVAILLLVFSVLSDQDILELFLSLTGRLIIIYQCGFLWRFCADCSFSIRYLAVILQMVFTGWIFALSIVIAVKNDDTEVWKITILSFFAIEYVLLDIVYLSKFWRDYWRSSSLTIDPKGLLSSFFSKDAKCILLWSFFFCIIVWIVAFASLSLYLKNQISYIISLWIDIMAAVVWFLRWLALQFRASIEAQRSDSFLALSFGCRYRSSLGGNSSKTTVEEYRGSLEIDEMGLVKKSKKEDASNPNKS